MSTPAHSEPDSDSLHPERTESSGRPGTDADLVEMLADAEAQVQRLKGEIERRRRDQYRAQHEEIDRLAEHLEKAQVNWQQVREFFESAISEYRAGSSWADSGDTSDRPAPSSQDLDEATGER